MKQKILLSALLLVAVYHDYGWAQSTYKAPELSNQDSWSMIMLPDPQGYSKLERNQPIFELMTAWISENVDNLNIKMVVCTGDLVEHNEMINPSEMKVNQTSKAQWEFIAGAFGRLDGKVPYINAAGNHDYGYVKSFENRKSHYGKYFPVDKNFQTQKLIREAALNAEGDATLENAILEFSSPQGKNYLLMNLEFAPRDTVVAWAKRITEKEQYKNHTIILLTHSYLNNKSDHIKEEIFPVAVTDVNSGEDIWKKLVRPSKNIRMVLAGHIGGSGVAFRTDTNFEGEQVHQIVFNAQVLGGGNKIGNGGDGWLRILEFLPDGKTVRIKTFSPFFAISPTTQKYAWRTGLIDQFEISLE